MASRKGPPTEKQLERIDELLDHPAMNGYMDSLAGKWDQLIATMGGAGVLIGWMKSIIVKSEQEEVFAYLFPVEDKRERDNPENRMPPPKTREFQSHGGIS